MNIFNWFRFTHLPMTQQKKIVKQSYLVSSKIHWYKFFVEHKNGQIKMIGNDTIASITVENLFRIFSERMLDYVSASPSPSIVAEEEGA